MQAKKKYLLTFSLLLCVVAAMMGFSYYVKARDREQVEFITSFYKNYLSMPETQQGYYVIPPGSFYSKGAEARIETNAKLCGTLSRGDEICGYGADYDVFLDAQEIDPKLSFEKAGFKAVVSGKNTVDVSFKVYPEYGADYDRKMRYVLVKENSSWRVDDVLVAEKGRFSERNSMRNEIEYENQHILEEAREISEAATWVFSYLRDADMLDRAERFVAFPVQLCSAVGTCQTLQKGDTRLRQTMLALHKAYYKGDSDTTVLDGYWPKPGLERVEQGKVIKLDAFNFTFQGKAWWITKIDLSSVGRTIPVQRQQKVESQPAG
ncbi:hypothetical protein [Massilia horti]|uniref:hypothetical protein n=1 Tax=Massilia horti TaxID=2562153 RepID=UPI00142FCE37|nr:hypothetical protein [Massilia horti]